MSKAEAWVPDGSRFKPAEAGKAMCAPGRKPWLETNNYEGCAGDSSTSGPVMQRGTDSLSNSLQVTVGTDQTEDTTLKW